jgi:hypothetical protein
MIRSVLVFSLLAISLCASANAATVHRARPPVGHHIRPSPGVTGAVRFTVPGWTDEQTRYWLSFPQVTD